MLLVVPLAALGALVLPAASGATPPDVSLSSPTSVQDTSVTLNGSVTPNDLTGATWVFKYSTDMNFAVSSTGGTILVDAPTSVSDNIASLTPGTTYNYELCATNTDLTTPTVCTASTFTTAVSVPPTVTTGNATAGPSTATLNGTVNPNGTSTNYFFQWGTDQTYGNSTMSTSAGSVRSGVAAMASLSGLASNTTFHFQLCATNSAGTACGSDNTFTTVAKVPDVLTTVATNVQQTAAALNGTVNPNGSATSYWFNWGTTTSYLSPPTSPTSAGAGTSPAGASANLTGLTPNTTYHFQLCAMNSSGTNCDGDQSFKTSPKPPDVSTLAATSITATGATLNGIVNPNGAATSYYFQYGTSALYGQQTAQQSAGSGTSTVSASISVSTLSPHTTYHFRLCASNSAGLTCDPNDTTFSTPALPPTVSTGSASSVGQTTATLTGVVSPNGVDSTAHFDYGQTTAYGFATPNQGVAASGGSNQAVTANLKDLLAGTTYHYRLEATNSSGTTLDPTDHTFKTVVPTLSISDWQGPEGNPAPTDCTPPSQCAVFTITMSNPSSQTVQVNASTADGSAKAYVDYKPIIGSVSTLAPGTTSITLSVPIIGNTTAGQGTRTFVVNISSPDATKATVARSQATGTILEDDCTVTPPGVAAGAPTGITASGATLNGSVNPGGDGTAKYHTLAHFDYGLTTAYGSSAPVPDADVGSDSVSHAVNPAVAGLSANTTYHFRLVAKNDDGCLAATPDSTFTTGSPPPPPPPPPPPAPVTTQDVKAPTAPTHLIATPAPGPSVRLSWSPSTDDSGRIASYWIIRNGSIMTVPGNQTSFPDQTVEGPIVATYTVRAVDPSGNISAPSKPATLRVPSSTDSPFLIPMNRRSVSVTAAGVAPVTVTCLPFFLHCGGKLTLMLGKQKLGSRKLGIASGRGTIVRVVLSDRAFRTLLRKRTLRVTVLFVSKNGLGDQPAVRRTKLTLKAPKGVGLGRRPQVAGPSAG